MDNIDIYNNSAIILNRKAPKSIISWITILILLLILLTIFLFVPFNVYKTYSGYVSIDNDYSYLNLFVNISDFPINKSNNLYIKNDKYKYEIISINEGELKLKVNLEDKIRFENNIVIVNILKDRTTVFKMLKNKIKKGFGL